MSNPQWIVHPHSPLESLSERLYRVEGSVSRSPLKRQMIIIKSQSGLYIHNPVAVDANTLQEIDALGDVRGLIIPGAFHTIDGEKFFVRYPKAKCFAPTGALKRLAQKMPFAFLGYDALLEEKVCEVEMVEGTERAEGVFIVREKNETTLIFNDILFNHPHVAGFGGFVLKMIGSSGGPRVTRIAKTLMIKNKPALREQLLRLADVENLTRVIPGHGDVINQNAAERLREVANAL